jgi:DnaJ-related protein SCJ1
MANDDPDYTTGDLVFVVKELPHPLFVRKDNDLHMKISIGLIEALTKFSRNITHFDNHTVEIQGQGITQPGTVKKIPFEGMPIHGAGSQIGDLYAEIKVLFPKSLSNSQTEGYFSYSHHSFKAILC